MGYPNMHSLINSHLKIDLNRRETNKYETPEQNIFNGIPWKATGMPQLIITLFPQN